MELDGFILVGSSSRKAMTQDLMFKKPITEGDIEIYVETKYDDISLSDKSFLTEFARYFLLYIAKKEKTFDFYIFIRKCRNWNKWKKIFDSKAFDQAVANIFYQNMCEKADLTPEESKKIGNSIFAEFERFLADSYVNQISYDRLLMEITERSKNTKDIIGYDFYLQEFRPIIAREQILGNFAKITSWPEYIYEYNTIKKIELDEFDDPDKI